MSSFAEIKHQVEMELLDARIRARKHAEAASALAKTESALDWELAYQKSLNKLRRERELASAVTYPYASYPYAGYPYSYYSKYYPYLEYPYTSKAALDAIITARHESAVVAREKAILDAEIYNAKVAARAKARADHAKALQKAKEVEAEKSAVEAQARAVEAEKAIKDAKDAKAYADSLAKDATKAALDAKYYPYYPYTSWKDYYYYKYGV